MSVAVTTAMTVSERDPQAVLRIWNGSAANAAAALAVTQSGGSAPDVAQARALARAALVREPVNVGAVAVIGLLDSMRGDMAGADKAFAYAESLSRRNLATQLWMIERRVALGDVAGALKHYDRALRANLRAHGLLLPVLVQAAADPTVGRPLSQLLANRPPWWGSYTTLVVKGSNSPYAIASVIRSLKLDRRDTQDRYLLSIGLTRLVELGAMDRAADLFAQAPGSVSASALLRPFGVADAVPPFDWMLTDEPDLAGIVDPRDSTTGGAVLRLLASNGKQGVVARQTLVLKPGIYTLSAAAGDTGNDPQTRPKIDVSCIGGVRASVLSTIVPEAGPSGRQVRYSFTIPPACRAQQVSLTAMSPVGGGESEPWISGMRIARGAAK